jgi:hypothetical protein
MSEKNPSPRSSELPAAVPATFGCFELGRLLATPGALECLRRSGVQPVALIALHARKEWGTVDAEDARANERAIMNGGRILSAYDADGEEVYVITEAVGDDGHRACTTVLLASEY